MKLPVPKLKVSAAGAEWQKPQARGDSETWWQASQASVLWIFNPP